MSGVLPKQASRRFLDLQVNEVSLVDTPANEQVFLVAKRHDQDTQEVENMGQTAEQAATTGEDAARVPVDVAKAESDAVKVAMEQVTGLIDGIAKAAGVQLNDSTDSDSTDADGQADNANANSDSDVQSVETEKAGMSDMRKMYEAELKGAGIKGDALKACMTKFDKRFGSPPFKTDAKPPLTKTQKRDGDGAENEATTVDSTIEATLDTIQKAKAFTPARIAKLAEAMETLQKLMMEVISPGMSPATRTPGVSQHSNPNTTRSALSQPDKVPTMKREDIGALLRGLDDVVTKMEAISTGKTEDKVEKRDDTNDVDVKKTLEGITKRLEAIENARPAPDSEGDSGTETTETKKGFWHGVL